MRIQNALFRDAFEYTVRHLTVVCDHLVLFPIHPKVGMTRSPRYIKSIYPKYRLSG